MRATLEKGSLCCANLLLRLRVEYSCLLHQSNYLHPNKYIYILYIFNYQNTPFLLLLHVTKTVKCRYLGNWEWYHRSAGDKTTGKILSIIETLYKAKHITQVWAVCTNGPSRYLSGHFIRFHAIQPTHLAYPPVYYHLTWFQDSFFLDKNLGSFVFKF